MRVRSAAIGLLAAAAGAAAAGAAAAGCASYDPPPGFFEVDSGPYEWRAMTAEGVVLAVDVRTRDPAGSIDFWSTVLQKEIEAARGYLMRSSEDVGSGRGMLFTVAGPENQGYYVAAFLETGRVWLFFKKDWLRTVEAGGPKKELDKVLPAIKVFAEKIARK